MISDKYSEYYTDTQIFDELLYPLCKPESKDDKKKINLSSAEIKVPPVEEEKINESISSGNTIVDSDSSEDESNGKLLNSILKSKDSVPTSKHSSFVVQFNPAVTETTNTIKPRFAFRDDDSTDDELNALEEKQKFADAVSQKLKNLKNGKSIRDMDTDEDEEEEEEEKVEIPIPKAPKRRSISIEEQPSYMKYPTREAYDAAESSDSEVEFRKYVPPPVKNSFSKKPSSKKIW
jgi:hypothetical protein